MADMIDPDADIIDSRDVAARLEELADQDAEANDPDALFPAEPLSADEREELDSLRALTANGRAAAGTEWDHGVALITDSYFEDYARQLAEDIGAVPADAAWPAYCIDWERAARDLQADYTSVEWEGTTFWVRA